MMISMLAVMTMMRMRTVISLFWLWISTPHGPEHQPFPEVHLVAGGGGSAASLATPFDPSALRREICWAQGPKS